MSARDDGKRENEKEREGETWRRTMERGRECQWVEPRDSGLRKVEHPGTESAKKFSTLGDSVSTSGL